MGLTSFAEIKANAEARHGKDALAQRIAERFGRDGWTMPGDDRLLAAMARYIFAAGISRKVVDNKWPGIEEAFLGFDPNLLNLQPDDFWHERLSDTRVVRHGAKIDAIRHNAALVSELGKVHGGAVRYLLDWPDSDQISLIDLLTGKGARLGGLTGQYVLREIGKDCFVLSKDVIACLKASGVAITGDGNGKAERRAIQQAFDTWAAESGVPMSHISLTCALSVG